jgi:two-component system LytT family response regulator
MPMPPSEPARPLRVLVVDDEAPARQRLVELLRDDGGVAAIAEASDGKMAVQMIVSAQPDLVFLDIQMPELTGLEVVAMLGPERLPLTIFVTAYDQHAIRAFEANALDYLLKPFSDERFERAMARAKTRLEERQMRAFGDNVVRLLSARAPNLPPPPAPDRLAVKSGRATQFVRVAEIDWIEGAGVYVTLHTGGRQILHRVSLSELADSLDPQRFIRIHRSVIVNLDSIVQLEPISHGEFDVVLKDGARRRVSRTYRALLEKRLGQPL